MGGTGFLLDLIAGVGGNGLSRFTCPTPEIGGPSGAISAGWGRCVPVSDRMNGNLVVVVVEVGLPFGVEVSNEQPS
jgi:hypothetical protein